MMNEQQRLAFQRDWQAQIDKQPRHPIYLPVRVRWDLPWDERGAVVEIGQRVAIDETNLESSGAEARRDPWEDATFVLDRRFQAWAGCEFTAEGYPLLPWSVTAEGGVQAVPLRLLIQARNLLCAGTDKDPFAAGWLSEGYRAVFTEMCKHRLGRPGEVLELLLLGGNRAGKTFAMLLASAANWRAAPRPEGAEYGPQWKGQSLVMHSGETSSRSEHQVPLYYFLPESVRKQARGTTGNTRMAKTEDTVFNFSGSGFTNDTFNLPIEVTQADGSIRTTGGEMRFRSYNGQPNTYEGPEYNLIIMDEEVSVSVYENMKRGMTSRAVVTNEQWFLDEIQRLLTLLEAGTPMTSVPRELIGLMVQSWEIAMFTPVSGFTQLVRVKLQGVTTANMYGWYQSPILAAMPGVSAGEYDGDGKLKPGSDKRKVPQFAKDPANPNQLIAWFHTRWNCVKPAVRTMLNTYKASGWKEVRKRLYGYVESDTASAFGTVYDEERHLFDWHQCPNNGSIYEVIDPADAKPWAISWDLIDPFERDYQLQEWPCEHIPVGEELPGPWAVPSLKKERFNGEEGPAWSLPQRSISSWVLQVWEGRRRVLEKMKEHGVIYRGRTEKRKLVLEWCPDGKGGINILKEDEEREYIVPEMTVMDSRFAASHTDSVRGNADVTIAERVLEDPNSILITAADGVRLAEGDTMIIDRLTRDIMGLPSVRINRECTNTRFMFRYYTRPQFKETTAAKDEVCKEWRDLKAYLYLKRPTYIDPSPPDTPTWRGF
jgi:hypothetical protein